MAADHGHQMMLRLGDIMLLDPNRRRDQTQHGIGVARSESTATDLGRMVDLPESHVNLGQRCRIDILIDLWHNKGIGFAVYTTELGFFEGAEFGEKLDIRSTIEMDGDYRIIWHQEAWRPNSKKAAVKSRLELVCIDKDKKLLPILDVVNLQFN